jgi:cysteine desulfurase / selenocysteine lyase
VGVYLDNAATSHPKPPEVYAAADEALRRGGSANRGVHAPGMVATRELFDVREKLAAFLSIGDSARLAFTASATDSLNIALKGWLRPGDHVVVSAIEHNAVVRPLHALARRGVRLSTVPARAGGELHPGDMLAAVERDTRLVICTHASNVLGAMVPVEALGAALEKRGVPLLVDASQTLGYLDVDVKAMGAAMLAAPGHKGLLGPAGTGLLYVREDIQLETWREGGTGTESSRVEMPAAMPERLEAGTHNLSGLAGLAAGVDWLKRSGLARVREIKRKHIEHILSVLAEHRSVRVVSAAAPERLSNLVTFAVDGVSSELIAARLAASGIAVRGGLHCAPSAHVAAGTTAWGAVRLSPGVFTREEEIDEFNRALGAILTEAEK